MAGQQQPKSTEFPRFFCASYRTILICISGLSFLLSLVSIIMAIFGKLHPNDVVPLLCELPVFLGAMAMTKMKLKIAKIALVLYLTYVFICTLILVVWNTTVIATEKVDDSIGFLFSANATTDKPLFERKEHPVMVFRHSLIVGYGLEIGFAIAFAFIYLQYFLVNRLLEYVNFMESREPRPVSQA